MISIGQIVFGLYELQETRVTDMYCIVAVAAASRPFVRSFSCLGKSACWPVHAQSSGSSLLLFCAGDRSMS